MSTPIEPRPAAAAVDGDQPERTQRRAQPGAAEILGYAQHTGDEGAGVARPVADGVESTPGVVGVAQPDGLFLVSGNSSSTSRGDPDPFSPFPHGGGNGERVVEDGSRPVPGTALDPFPGGNGSLTDRGGSPHTVVQPSTLQSRKSGAAQLGLARQSTQSCSWLPIDASEIVAGLQSGQLSSPVPTVGPLTEGGYVLYAGATNGIAGESGSGKTWSALAIAAGELAVGHAVVLIDLEDNPVGVLARLLALGVDQAAVTDPLRFAYLHPDEAFRDDVRQVFWEVLERLEPSLVVLDSTGESMALEGTDPNSDVAVAEWFQRVATAIAQRGPAVLLIDHLPKASTGATSPIGSQRKRAAISGVQFIQTVSPKLTFAKGRAGEATLTVTKDRHGTFVQGEPACRLMLRPEPSRGDAGVEVKLVAAGANEDWVPRRRMDEVSASLEASSPQTTTELTRSVGGKKSTLLDALRVLVESGYITVQDGPRGSRVYSHVQRYQVGDPFTVPEDLERDVEPDAERRARRECDHEWHSDICKPDWCHTGHYGSCN